MDLEEKIAVAVGLEQGIAACATAVDQIAQSIVRNGKAVSADPWAPPGNR